MPLGSEDTETGANYFISVSDLMAGALLLFIILLAGIIVAAVGSLERPRIKVEPPRWDEPSKSTIYNLPVNLEKKHKRTVHVLVTSQSETAEENRDYTRVAEVLTFLPGQILAEAPVELLPDSELEGEERFNLIFRVVGTQEGEEEKVQATIVDDGDAPPALPPRMILHDTTIDEPQSGSSSSKVRVSLSSQSDSEVRAIVKSHDLTAESPSDYAPVASLLRFGPGQVEAELDVKIYADEFPDEGKESFALKVVEIAGARGLDERCSVFIVESGVDDRVSSIFSEMERTRAELLNRIKKRLSRKNPMWIAEVQLETGVLRLPEHLLFDSGEAELKPEGRDVLHALGSVLVSVVPDYTDAARPYRLEAIYLEGHTDSDPIARENIRDNWDLSTFRATNSYRALKSGAPRIRELTNASGRKIFSLSGYGETRPVAPNQSDAEKARNRRIDLRFIMEPPPADRYREILRGRK